MVNVNNVLVSVNLLIFKNDWVKNKGSGIKRNNVVVKGNNRGDDKYNCFLIK